jgi:hypothetical protein
MNRTWTDDELINAVKTSSSVTATCLLLNLRPTGRNHSFIKQHIRRLGISTSHFNGMTSGLRRVNAPRRTPDSEIFKKNGKWIGTALRKRVIADGRLVYKCDICPNDGTHMGKPLTLHLDHKDGDHFNSEWSNLRWLCPNCHTQTPTYARSHRDLKARITLQCATCKRSFERRPSRIKTRTAYCSQLCSARGKKKRPQLVDRENVKQLFAQLNNCSAVARQLGVSSSLISKIVRGVKY